MHLLAPHCILNIEFVHRNTVELNHLSELRHVCLYILIFFIEQQGREHRHLDFIEPIESPLCGLVGEDVLHSLVDLSLDVNRFKVV